jgi:hypothetical protein
MSFVIAGKSPVTLLLNDGTTHQLCDVLRRVIDYWRTNWFPTLEISPAPDPSMTLNNTAAMAPFERSAQVQMKSQPGPPATLGSTAAAQARIVV